ncbi:uncharacterized protein LOC133920909 isoform X2 [Phragmites australis]|uniref:uncharacterized protein LOC133920909 isoform X2 n=1 Tax=Phragmites australis TaxID=29695 RepID=UPI002D76CC42|nr:uncharacterized protein LOC133920909 isoform X2 [Phragmites australis]
MAEKLALPFRPHLLTCSETNRVKKTKTTRRLLVGAAGQNETSQEKFTRWQWPPPPPTQAAAAPSRAPIRPTRPPPSRLAFLTEFTISLPRGPRRAPPPAATAEERVAEEKGPAWVELEPISSEQRLDRALEEAQQLDLPIVLLWMASWCRKCIYLTPKLEKLAAEYHPGIRFYSVDVNAVPQKLVNCAGVTGSLSMHWIGSSVFCLSPMIGAFFMPKYASYCKNQRRCLLYSCGVTPKNRLR